MYDYLRGNRWWKHIFFIWVILNGCSAALQPEMRASDPGHEERVIGDLTPDIEALYLSWHDLDQVYKDIKFLERGFLFDENDRQLGHVQKAALYVQDASVRIHHRWEQLAVLHYIRPEMLRDYLTLGVKGLTSAKAEIDYDLNFLHVYTAFIENDGMLEAFDRARGRIERCVDLMDRILKKLVPLTNDTAKSTRM